MLSDLDLVPSPQNDVVFKMIFADPKHDGRPYRTVSINILNFTHFHDDSRCWRK